jgi:hypothetical protein
MKNLLIAFDPDEPAQSREVAALAEQSGPGWSIALVPLADDDDAPLMDIGQPPDILLGYAPGPIKVVRAHAEALGWQAPIIARWLPTWPADLDRFHPLYDRVDGVVFADRLYWEHLGQLPRTDAVGPGVDVKLLPAPPTDRILWVGAEDPTQWSAFEVAPRQMELVSDIAGCPIDVLTVERAKEIADDRDRLREWLESGSIVVCAHRRCDLPMILLDAAGAGRSIVCAADADPDHLVNDGVNGRVFERSVVTDDTRASVIDAIRAVLANRAAWSSQMHEDLSDWSWESRADTFFSTLRGLAEGTAPPVTIGHSTTTDLRDAVTVFVTTVGAPSFDACERHLDHQDCRFRREVIRNVAPMSAAFQCMLDRCETPYYAQVDENMLLYPWAVRALHAAISQEADTIALVVAYLHDAHLGKVVQGVKIFRHRVAQCYPLLDEGSFEFSQLDRMQADGYGYRILPPVPNNRSARNQSGPFGLHGTHSIQRSVYERYLTVARERIRRPEKQKWLEAETAEFINRFFETRDPLDLYAFVGVLSGTLLGAAHDFSKDFREYDTLPGFRQLQDLIDDIEAASRGAKRHRSKARE